MELDENSTRNKEDSDNCQFLTDFLSNNHPHNIINDDELKCSKQLVRQRRMANIRERKRMQSINDAFESLREHVPSPHYERKLSKADTLKLAIGYIAYLTEILSDKKHQQSAKQNEDEIGKSIVDSDQPRKIFICCHQYRIGSDSIAGYSLSWTNERHKHRGRKIVAKLWKPSYPIK